MLGWSKTAEPGDYVTYFACKQYYENFLLSPFLNFFYKVMIKFVGR